MLKNKKLFLWGMVLLVLLIASFFLYRQWNVAKETKVEAPTIGIVNMEKVMIVHPLYTQYQTLKGEYETLQAEYRAEQRMLSEKAAAEQKALDAVHKNPALYASLNEEYKAKIAAKEDEINSKLAKEYAALIQAYRRDYQVAGNDVNIEVVNLQLALQGLHLSAEERSQKETRLKELLALGNGAPDVMERVNKAVNEAMAPKRAAAEAELVAYEKELVGGIVDKRDQKLSAEAESIMAVNKLPNAALWNEEWKKKLMAKQLEVNSMEKAILDDIKARVKAIAESKKLELVLTQVEAKQNVLDITDAVIASYH